MPRFSANLLAVWVCLGFALSAAATGPSDLEISIVPLGTSEDGAIIFKTKKSGNATGGHTILARSAEYGWICLGADGSWMEWTHTTVTAESVATEVELRTLAGEELYSQRLQQADDVFEGLSFGNPPPELDGVLKECSNSDWRVVDPSTGKGRARWSPERFCLDGRCIDTQVIQRTLGEVSSSSGLGTVESTFFYNGVAVFENVDDCCFRDSVGAEFPIEDPSCKGCVFDVMEISGISLVPESLKSRGQ